MRFTLWVCKRLYKSTKYWTENICCKKLLIVLYFKVSLRWIMYTVINRKLSVLCADKQ